MKRRSFIGKLGISVPSVYSGTSLFSSQCMGNPNFVYPDVNTIEGAKTEVAPDTLGLDRIVINLGVWTVYDGQDQSIGVYFNDLALKKPSMHLYSSSVEGENIELKKDKDLWIFRNKHVAGEHQYLTEPV